jgi:hypothetical protein
MTTNAGKNKKVLSESHACQIRVLRALSCQTAADAKLYQMEEICDLSGMRDEKEVLRYLYILEGQSLVTPHPAGDFTSKTWKVTSEGVKTWKTIAKSFAVQ